MLISIDVKLISAFRRLFLGKFAGYLTIIPRDSQRRLQNSPYFCVFKYARAVKQKVWNEAENRERDSYATLYRFLYWFWKKKPTVLQSTANEARSP